MAHDVKEPSWCSVCRDTCNATIEDVTETLVIDGTHVEYPAWRAICPRCGSIASNMDVLEHNGRSFTRELYKTVDAGWIDPAGHVLACDPGLQNAQALELTDSDGDARYLLDHGWIMISDREEGERTPSLVRGGRYPATDEQMATIALLVDENDPRFR